MAFATVPAWSTTAGSNTEIDGISLAENVMVPSAVNNAFREMMSQIAEFTRRGSDLASAATLDLDSIDTMFLDITGTTTVTAVTLTDGHSRRARATGAFQITASATLVVNGSTSSNYTTTAGDLLFFEGYGSSTVRVWTVTGGGSSIPYTAASSSGAAYLDFAEDTDNGSNRVRLQGAASTADITVTLPTEAGTVVVGSASSTDNNIPRFDGTLGKLQAGSGLAIDDTFNITMASPSGAEGTKYPAFFARAWAVFNGTGTPAISASGNVSSITDNGTGDYTINFTTALPDANYAPAIAVRHNGTIDGVGSISNATAPTSSALRIHTFRSTTESKADYPIVSVIVVR